MRQLEGYKPAVPKCVLILLAGLVWAVVGATLLYSAVSLLANAPQVNASLFLGIGLVSGLFVHHFGFLRIVDRNLARIGSSNDRTCVFAFMSWKNYLNVAVMVTMGALLRHSSIPRQYLATLYAVIGLALMLSSVRYARFFVAELRHPD